MKVIQTKGYGDEGTSPDGEQRCPETPSAGQAQTQHSQNAKGRDCNYGSRDSRGVIGKGDNSASGYGDDGRGEQQEGGTGDHRRYDPAQQRQPGGEAELGKATSYDQGGEQSWTAGLQGRNANDDERHAGSRQEHMACAESPDPSGLERGNNAADKECGESGPSEVAVGLARHQCSGGNCRDHGGQNQQHALESRDCR